LSSTFEVDDTVDEPIDGRTARAVRTRHAIVDACIELVAEGDLRPTAPRIAERASVSVRSIFQHFDDLETLYTAVGARVAEQVVALHRPIDPSAPLADRVKEFLDQRCAMNETLSPTMRAAVVHAPGSQTINRQFQVGHSWLGELVESVFGADLDPLEDRRGPAFHALWMASSWSTWNLLRTVENRSIPEARAVVAGLFSLVWPELAGGEEAVG